MSDLHALLHWLQTIPAELPWLIALAIVAGTLVHEDLTTVVTGMLVADGDVRVVVALPALYAGIVIGDIGLYGLGRLIATHRLSQRFTRGRRFATMKHWLDQRLITGVFVVRFLPGLRLPAYTAYGFFAMSLRRFLVSVVFAAAIWTSGLFYLSYKFAALTQHWLGVLHWPVIIIAAIVPLLIVRHMVMARIRGDDADDDGNPPE